MAKSGMRRWGKRATNLSDEKSLESYVYVHKLGHKVQIQEMIASDIGWVRFMVENKKLTLDDEAYTVYAEVIDGIY